MDFGGFQKLTLLDYPGKVACTVFTIGCNFYCPFCHNSYLVDELEKAEKISDKEVLSYLKKRKGILDGVCISGGEPLLHKETIDFIREIKKLGLSVKLDTNGSFPSELKYLVENHLIDYVAMDVKNSIEKYPITVGCENILVSDIEKSIDFLLEGNIDYEFRTTVVCELHTIDDIEKISKRIKGAKKYFLQNFVDSGHIIGKSLHPVSLEALEKMKKIAEKNIEQVKIRGIA